jgi:ribulose-5-phosphate 4-epimerase/fuculose-1-phosphate aldolase
VKAFETSETNTKSVRIRELVLANHILALEGVLDAYGHVSIRNPDDPNTFLMSRSRSPEIVAEDDILVHDLSGSVAGVADRELYRERFIHASIYAGRPDVGAVIHSHADEVLPFGISDIPLQAVVHSASLIGADPVPVWDSRTEFGDTNLLVESTAMGESLARKMNGRALVLMRGHGFAAAAKNLISVVKMATALPRNARVLLDVLQAGGKVTPLSPGEAAAHAGMDMSAPAAQRQWEYWCRKLGVPYQPGGY